MDNAAPIPALFDLKDKVACVTGASSGLGRRAALVLAQSGAKVVAIARRADALALWQAEAGKDTATIAHDLSDRSSLADLADRIAAPFGAPDIVVHAAGINTRQTADNVTAEGGT